MSAHVLSAPLVEPVSIADCRTWLRLSHQDDDALIARMISAWRDYVEHATGRVLIAQSWREQLDAWPPDRLSASGMAVRMARMPLISIEAVRVFDGSGAPQLWDTDQYRVETGEPGRLVVLAPFNLPAPGRPAGGIEIDFTAGYGAHPEDVPAPLREAILQGVAVSYGADRLGGDIGSEPSESIDRLIAPYRRARL